MYVIEFNIFTTAAYTEAVSVADVKRISANVAAVIATQIVDVLLVLYMC